MKLNEFNKLVDDIIEQLETISQTNSDQITSCNSGDKFELLVVNVLNSIVQPDIKVHHSPGGHGFPDIVIEDTDGTKFGIEVKSSSSSRSKGWKINGNSVMGSTRDPEVIETVIIFGKTSKQNMGFKARKYEDCVTNVVVTHSPRYSIDMDLPEGETFFERSKIPYKTIADSDNPISIITAYFQAQGQQAWWLSNNSPAAIRFINDLPPEDRNEFFAFGLAHFPEILSEKGTKYKRLAFWLTSEQSIVSVNLRDNFSASGRVNLFVNGNSYGSIPRIFQTVYDLRTSIVKLLEDASNEELIESWGEGSIDSELTKDKVKAWINVCAPKIGKGKTPQGTTPKKLLLDIFSEDL